MAFVFRCDRCNKHGDENYRPYVAKLVQLTAHLEDDPHDGGRVYLQVCATCAHEIRTVLRQVKKGE